MPPRLELFADGVDIEWQPHGACQQLWPALCGCMCGAGGNGRLCRGGGVFRDFCEHFLSLGFKSEPDSLAVPARELLFYVGEPCPQALHGCGSVLLASQSHPGEGHGEDFPECAQIVF